MMNDFRLALRRLASTPAWTATIVLTLALAIGANTAVFTLVRSILFAPLPFPDSERLVDVYILYEGDEWTASPPDFFDWQRMARSFESLAGYWGSSAALTGRGDAAQVRSANVTAGFFHVLGTPPLTGRAFTPGELEPGGENVAIVSHGLWQRTLGGSEGVLGTPITLDGEPVTVIGVMPPGFAWPGETEIWRPARFSAEEMRTQRGAHYLTVIGKLKPGVTIEAATAEMQQIGRFLESEYPKSNEGWGDGRVRTVLEKMTGDVRAALLLLFASVATVLLIACANVGNLLLARAIGRQREVAVRAALGASRWRIARQLLVESLVLAVAGGLLGLILGAWGVALATGLEIDALPRLEDVELDGLVLAFTAGLSLLTALVLGTAPAMLIAGRRNLDRTLREDQARSGEGDRGRRMRSLLVVTEIALSLLLLSSAGVLIRTFVGLVRTDPGFDPAGVVSFQLSLPESRYGEGPRVASTFAELAGKLEAIPGVERAGAIFGLPMSGFSYSISVEKLDEVAVDDEDDRSVQIRVITPGYLETMRMRLLSGRGITSSDTATTEDVVLVNEAAAELLWPGADAVGRTLRVGTRLGGEEQAGGRVVGVVANVRHEGLGADAPPELYLPHAQNPVDFAAFVVRSSLGEEALVPAIRTVVRQLDPALPIFRIEPMPQYVDDSVLMPRVLMILLATLAGMAMILVAVGIFALLAYSVSRRTREIGIRMALGAERHAILRSVTRDAVVLTAAGIAIGAIASLAGREVLAALIPELSTLDVWTWIAAAAVLGAVALLASWVPAVRASRVQPVEALRHE